MTQALQMRVNEIAAEAERAMGLHPTINSAHESYAVILEELDEYWELVKVNPNRLTPLERADRINQMHKELMHTAAMCLRAMLDLEL